ncbi:MAG: aminotransferase class V-fold PLP-dependent enzyme [Cyclobacteriaceae bacterium]
MITFYPGPSKIYPKVATYVREGLESGIISMNHRSSEFMALMDDTKKLLKHRLNIPEEYRIIFTSSATECWEILAQSLIKEKSLHFYNGAFGKKWMDYTSKLGLEVQDQQFDLEGLPQISNATVDLVCFTQNETSNGTQVPAQFISDFTSSENLIAMDATSSMAGIDLDFSKADIWFASVQKCFGLPSGMALMILSSKAVLRAYEIDERNHYNSLAFILDNEANNQTPYTPNILNIFLLNCLLKDLPKIDEVNKLTLSRYSRWVDFFSNTKRFGLLIKNDEVRSKTVLTVIYDSDLNELKQKAKQAGIVLGNGYGKWKETSFRIANFPAIAKGEIEELMEFLSSQDTK